MKINRFTFQCICLRKVVTAQKNLTVAKWHWNGKAFVRSTPFENQVSIAKCSLLYKQARYYNNKKGLFVSADPLGFDTDEDIFHDGLSLYRFYAPVNGRDPLGLECCDTCGKEVGPELRALIRRMYRGFWNVLKTGEERHQVCRTLPGVSSWDIMEFFAAGGGGRGGALLGANKDVFGGPCNGIQQTNNCIGSVTVDGNCFWAAEVNYYLWGSARKMCDRFYQSVASHVDDAKYWGLVFRDGVWWNPDNRRRIMARITLGNTKRWVSQYRGLFYGYREYIDKKCPERRSRGPGISGRLLWTEAGWNSKTSLANAANINSRCTPCNRKNEWGLTGYIGQGWDLGPLLRF